MKLFWDGSMVRSVDQDDTAYYDGHVTITSDSGHKRSFPATGNDRGDGGPGHRCEDFLNSLIGEEERTVVFETDRLDPHDINSPAELVHQLVYIFFELGFELEITDKVVIVRDWNGGGRQLNLSGEEAEVLRKVLENNDYGTGVPGFKTTVQQILAKLI